MERPRSEYDILEDIVAGVLPIGSATPGQKSPTSSRSSWDFVSRPESVKTPSSSGHESDASNHDPAGQYCKVSKDVGEDGSFADADSEDGVLVDLPGEMAGKKVERTPSSQAESSKPGKEGDLKARHDSGIVPPPPRDPPSELDSFAEYLKADVSVVLEHVKARAGGFSFGPNGELVEDDAYDRLSPHETAEERRRRREAARMIWHARRQHELAEQRSCDCDDEDEEARKPEEINSEQNHPAGQSVVRYLEPTFVREGVNFYSHRFQPTCDNVYMTQRGWELRALMQLPPGPRIRALKYIS